MPRVFRPVLVALLVVGALGAAMYFRGRTAPVPPVFAAHTSFREGQALSATNGKPVLIFATADWCGPCQTFKRTTLVHPDVESYIRAHFVPVYLNVDEDPDAAASLGIFGIPASIVMRQGQAGERLERGADVEEYLSWLKRAAEAAPSGA